MKLDLIIIGGGPGGYVTAIRAAQLGLETAIVEADRMGGTCLIRGCIPTKTLFKDAMVYEDIKNAGKYGISVEDYSIDLNICQDEKNKIVDNMSRSVEILLEANGVQIEKGRGRIVSANEVLVESEDGKSKTLTGDKIIIATGSKPSIPNIKGVESDGVIDSTEALDLLEIPEKLVVIGGGVIGLEFASIYNSFGSEVVVVEFLDDILPMVDKEVLDHYKFILENKGIKIFTGHNVKEIKETCCGLKVSANHEGDNFEFEANKVLISTGREMFVDGLGLDDIGVEYDRTGIKVNEDYQTNIPSIYAIGDAIGGTLLAHVASSEGIVCVERMKGMKTSVDYSLIPNSIFTLPELSTIGRTEAELEEEGIEYITGSFMLAGNGKAISMQKGEGMVKIIASKDKEAIYGVHILGVNASDLIHEVAVAMNGMFTVEELIRVMHGHPTLPEAIAESAMDVLDRSIHNMPK